MIYNQKKDEYYFKSMWNNKNKTLYLLFIFGLITFLPSIAYAACTNPDRTDGAIVYNADNKVQQYCDGTNWVAMHGAGSGSGGCTNPARAEGAIIYNVDYHVMQACAGNVWKAMGPVPGAGGGPDTTTGLVAHWNLDEGSGTNAADSTGSYDGTFQGTPAWTTGQVGNAVNFNDNADYVEVTDDAGLEGFTALTLTAWVNPQGAPGTNWGRIVSKANGSTSDAYALSQTNTNKLGFRVTTENGTVTVTTNYFSLTPSTGWHHVAGVWDGKVMHLFVDGIVDVAADFSGPMAFSPQSGTVVNTSDNLGIGRHVSSSTRDFDGYIDDVRIYDRPLSPIEIYQLYRDTGGSDMSPGCGTSSCGGNPSERVAFTVFGYTGGRIGGVYGADARCQANAIGGGLSGTYKAWIADGDANTAPAVRFEQSSVPYVRPDGATVANNWTDLTDGTIANDLNIGSTGTIDPFGTSSIATNVDTDGTQGSGTLHCSGWTVDDTSSSWRGDVDFTDSYWTSRTTSTACNSGGHLDCFEQPASSGSGNCSDPAGVEGALIYNSSSRVMQYCDGANWIGIGPDACQRPGVPPGTQCGDGSIYAGTTPATGGKMFVTDDNQSASTQWKGSTGNNDISPDSDTDGAANHANITVAINTLPAMDLCETLDRHGRQDWYLPSKDELDVLQTNRAAIDANAAGNFTTDVYWSSSEYSGTHTHAQFLGSGFASPAFKNTSRDIRCVRRD